MTPRSRVLRGSAAAVIAPANLEPVERLAARPLRSGGPEMEVVVAARQEGYADGWQRGLEEGRAAGQAEAMREFRELLAPALAALDAARAQLLARDAVALTEIEGQVTALAVHVAEAVVGRELAAVDGGVLDAVQRALQLAPERGAVLLRLHPADVELVEATPGVVPGRDVTLVADPAVERGGCVVDVGACRIDAQVGPALARVRAVLGGAPA